MLRQWGRKNQSRIPCASRTWQTLMQQCRHRQRKRRKKRLPSFRWMTTWRRLKNRCRKIQMAKRQCTQILLCLSIGLRAFFKAHWRRTLLGCLPRSRTMHRRCSRRERICKTSRLRSLMITFVSSGHARVDLKSKCSKNASLKLLRITKSTSVT